MAKQKTATKIANMYKPKDIEKILNHLEKTRYPLRNKVVFLLSLTAGLRAKEIAMLEWRFVLNTSSTDIRRFIHVPDSISKGDKGGRKVPMNPKLRRALQDLYFSYDENTIPEYEDRIIVNQQRDNMRALGIVKLFTSWFKALKMKGYSSHSGRRTFITTLARTINNNGGSIYDVRDVAGHSDVAMTSKYVVKSNVAVSRAINAL